MAPSIVRGGNGLHPRKNWKLSTEYTVFLEEGMGLTLGEELMLRKSCRRLVSSVGQRSEIGY